MTSSYRIFDELIRWFRADEITPVYQSTVMLSFGQVTPDSQAYAGWYDGQRYLLLPQRTEVKPIFWARLPVGPPVSRVAKPTLIGA